MENLLQIGDSIARPSCHHRY